MNKYLTPAMDRVLRQLVEDGHDGDIVGERGQWWCGYIRTSWRTVLKLLRLCLIKTGGENHSEGFERYVINEEGKAILKDDRYIPRIVAALKKT